MSAARTPYFPDNPLYPGAFDYEKNLQGQYPREMPVVITKKPLIPWCSISVLPL